MNDKRRLRAYPIKKFLNVSVKAAPSFGLPDERNPQDTKYLVTQLSFQSSLWYNKL